MMNRLIQWIGKLTLGRDVTLALMLLRLISDAVKKRRVDDVAKFVYRQLPATWRAPKGPTTEAEFIELLQSGQLFLSKIHAVLKAA
jgi:hypothetical protein